MLLFSENFQMALQLIILLFCAAVSAQFGETALSYLTSENNEKFLSTTFHQKLSAYSIKRKRPASFITVQFVHIKSLFWSNLGRALEIKHFNCFENLMNEQNDVPILFARPKKVTWFQFWPANWLPDTLGSSVRSSAYRKPAFQPSAFRRLFIGFRPSAEKKPISMEKG